MGYTSDLRGYDDEGQSKGHFPRLAGMILQEGKLH